MTIEEAIDMLDTIDNAEEIELDDWEIEFIDSLMSWTKSLKRELTTRQEASLLKIYEKYFSYFSREGNPGCMHC